MIKAEHVSFEYFRRDENGNVSDMVEAVKDLSLEVKQGEFIGILGCNGSGKSTFAKMLNTLLDPTEGEIRIEGMSTRDESNTWNIRKNTGMVFQNPDNQIIGTIVEEDVAFGPENLGVPTDEIRIGDRWDDCISRAVPEPVVRWTEAESGNCGCSCNAA